MGKIFFIKWDIIGRFFSLVLLIGKCFCDIVDLYIVSVLYVRD